MIMYVRSVPVATCFPYLFIFKYYINKPPINFIIYFALYYIYFVWSAAQIMYFMGFIYIYELLVKK